MEAFGVLFGLLIIWTGKGILSGYSCSVLCVNMVFHLCISFGPILAIHLSVSLCFSLCILSPPLTSLIFMNMFLMTPAI